LTNQFVLTSIHLTEKSNLLVASLIQQNYIIFVVAGDTFIGIKQHNQEGQIKDTFMEMTLHSDRVEEKTLFDIDEVENMGEFYEFSVSMG
jgi:GTP cyclohydrolase III